MSYPKSVQHLALGLGLALGALHFAGGQAETSIPKEATGVAIESNVIYGMYSGTALLLDVHRPKRANGKGIVVVPGSGWHSPLGYGATGLKDTRSVETWGALTEAGYTLFIVNHRAAPRFQYPDAVQDVQRAVRFVRANAARFGVDGARLGALGHSSGAHLVSMLGTLSGEGDPGDTDPVNRVSARVQVVVAGAGALDLTLFDHPSATAMIAAFLGQTRRRDSDALYREASPISHVSAGSAPFLLVHGDADEGVPIANSERMYEALKKAGVDAELVRLPGAGHADFPVRLAVPWLNRHLLEVR